ncbi:MAG: hypothetical protein JOZ43_00125 [Acidobacteriales bacterium]|nr:hypothetical protein [Terriglobales bacterium]
MGFATSSEQERAEVDVVLDSGLFEKAPRLGKFFRYICERHLRGESEGVKEYSIAVEALGRPPDFDPKKDSIVRVEAHRLRKRLQEYYAGPGVGHPIEIFIPQGQYKPQFRIKTPPSSVQPETPVTLETPPGSLQLATLSLAEIPPVDAVSVSIQEKGRAWLILSVAALLALVAFVGVMFSRRVRHPRQTAPEITSLAPADNLPGEFRILAGYQGTPFTDRQGYTWGPDAYFSGGTAASLAPAASIEAEPDPHFLRSQRSGSAFRYDLPLRQTTYELHLYFAETEYGRGNPKGGGDGTRMFQVTMNGTPILTQFDPLMEAGAPNRMHERVFKDVKPAADGKLHLTFGAVTGPAFVNALALLPSSPGRIRPVRIVAQATPITDSDGHLWAADEYVCGGTLVFRRSVILNRPDKALYQGERYGNFTYRIPLAPGQYELTLHLAETWFGSPESRETAFNQRLFNVFANGAALLRNFDIATEAGGPNRAIDKVFTGLEPNAQGILQLEFVPVRNYAEVNAIEVVGMD